MQVIILAGGKGTRLLKFTKKPKIFARFGNITLIDLYLDIFKPDISTSVQEQTYHWVIPLRLLLSRAP